MNVVSVLSGKAMPLSARHLSHTKHDFSKFCGEFKAKIFLNLPVDDIRRSDHNVQIADRIQKDCGFVEILFWDREIRKTASKC